MKLFKNRGQKNSMKNSKGGAIPLLGVSMIVVLLTAAVYFVASYAANSYSQDNQLSNWSYLYTDRAGAVPNGELRIYNAQNPIVTGEGAKDNIYFTKLLEPSDTKTGIILITDYSPMKIRVNSKEIYNNQFDKEEYVGNCYNAITLEPSTHERQIEVFMKLPFSARFETYMDNGAASPMTVNRGFVLGCIIAGIGITALLVFGVMSLVRRRLFQSLAVAAVVACTGAALALHMLPEMTFMLNSPWWLRFTEYPVHMVFLITSVLLNRMFKNHRKTVVAILFAAILSAAAVMLSFSPLLVKISSVAMSVLTLAAMLYTVQVALMQLEHRTQYAAAVFVMCVYYTVMALIAAILLISRQRVLYIYNVTVSTFVVAGVLEFIYIQEHSFEKKNRELSVQSGKFESYVQYISEFLRNMFDFTDAESFYETAIGEINSLLLKYQPDNTSIVSCAAVRTDGGFEEKVNRGVTGCNYALIEENCGRSGKNCFFAETFFDCIVKDGDETGAVFHFENIRGGLDVFFMSMIETAYCGLETTYDNIFAGDGFRDINIIFEELAENTELDNGCSVDHLRHICDYTRELCLRSGMDAEKAEQIAVASKLHDLGKIAIPKYIIHKQARLTEEERTIINSHTEFGYTILSTYADDPVLEISATIARYHHERYDGTGVNGLKGENIPIEARIVTVCDVYDALVSERTYKKAWSREDALNFLRDNEGKLFDPVICEEFIKYIQEQD